MLFIEPVIGYRSWHISIGTYDLTSPIVQRKAWPTDHAPEAECIDSGFPQNVIKEQHASPKMGCKCGYYAWHTLDEAVERYSTGDRSIVGAVICWGKFVVATKGFRSQYMRPLALTDQLSPQARGLGWPALIEQVIEKYSIPLLPSDVLEEYAETWAEPMGINFTE